MTRIMKVHKKHDENYWENVLRKMEYFVVLQKNDPHQYTHKYMTVCIHS